MSLLGKGAGSRENIITHEERYDVRFTEGEVSAGDRVRWVRQDFVSDNDPDQCSLANTDFEPGLSTTESNPDHGGYVYECVGKACVDLPSPPAPPGTSSCLEPVADTGHICSNKDDGIYSNLRLQGIHDAFDPLGKLDPANDPNYNETSTYHLCFMDVDGGETTFTYYDTVSLHIEHFPPSKRMRLEPPPPPHQPAHSMHRFSQPQNRT